MDEEREEDGSPPPWEDNFIKRMIELRTAKMSQTELARQLNDRGLSFHQQTVQRIEKGERPLRLNEAHAIAEILGSDPSDMARSVTSDEQELQHAIGELQFYSWQSVASGLRWKHNWDRERHRLRVATAKLGEQQAPTEEKLQQTLQQAWQLMEEADKVDELLTECYRKLARIVSGQEDTLIESKVFDSLTRQDYTITNVPWSPHGPEEMFGINWSRRNDDAAVEDDVDFT
jgi:DNA-binding XRE family transcriptional regulator